MHCQNCGAKADGSSKFCWKCGKNLAASPKPAAGRVSEATRDEVGSRAYVFDVIRRKAKRRLVVGFALLAASIWMFVAEVSWLGVVLLCWGGWVVIRRLTDQDDRKHYIYKVASSAGYSNIGDLSEDFINAGQGMTEKIGDYTLNKKFLFKNVFFSFQIYPLSQLTWAYKRVTSHSINFIPTGKTYALVLHFGDKNFEISGSDEECTQYLKLLYGLCPNARFGYNE